MKTKIWSAILSAVLVTAMALAGTSAEAKRLGGGKSFGKQSSNVTQREAAPGGANSATNSAAKPATPAAAPAQAPKRPWGAMLGGLAAGLGLAWLASSLGLGGAFGQIIMFALLALVVMVVIGFVMRKLKGGAAAGARAARRRLPSRARAMPPPPRTTARKTWATMPPRAPGSAAAWLSTPTNTTRPRLPRAAP
jgi:predicted lipid-binding transport protein (Tim44 family)